MTTKKKPSQNSNAYSTIVDFANFLRQNGDKLFEKDSKLCLKTDQIIILQEYLQEIKSTLTTDQINENKVIKKNSNIFNAKDFVELFKSNKLLLIQDFLYKITSLKIISTTPLDHQEDTINLNIFGSLTYLEIKNFPLAYISNLQYLRSQLEVLTCSKSLTSLHELLFLCGHDNCNSPVQWHKLNILNLSHNQLRFLDNNFRLATTIEILDLSHNNLNDCFDHLHCLKNLKKLNLSFNRLDSIPTLYSPGGCLSSIEYLDLSYNNIDSIDRNRIERLDELKHLNLNSNLINSINQLNNLSVLKSIASISIRQNPVNINQASDSLIQELIDLVKYNKSKKTSEYVFTKFTKPRNLQSIPSLSQGQYKSPEIAIRNNSLASVRLNVATSLTATSYKRKSRLKVNNVIIDQATENPIEKDYILINSVTHEASSLPKEFVGSFTADYESKKLQTEIENLKKMRLNYGTDWLLSTPKLIVNEQATEVVEPVDDNTAPIECDKNIDDNGFESNSGQSSINILDSFVVYRSEFRNAIGLNRDLSGGHDNNNDKLKVCIISLSESSVIEKDEFNIEVLSIRHLSEVCDIKIVRDDDKNTQLTVIFKDSPTGIIYQFENDREFSLFIDVLQKILYNENNIKTCELVYCPWCNEFVQKSKFKMFEEQKITRQEEIVVSESPTNESEASGPNNKDFEDLTCTKCNQYLIKNNKIQNPNEEMQETENTSPLTQNSNILKKSPTFAGFTNKTPSVILQSRIHKVSSTVSLGASFTLKEALESFKEAEKYAELEDINHEESIYVFKTEESSTSDQSNRENSAEIFVPSTNDKNKKLESFLVNNKMNKNRLDEVTAECKRISNNLKLYMIVNVLKNDESASLNDEPNPGDDEPAVIKSKEEDEVPIAVFRMKYFFYRKNLTDEELKQLKNPLRKINSCVCLLTNRNVIVFKLLDAELFNKSIDFDICIRRKLTIDISQIETIEVGLGQNYLFIEKNVTPTTQIANYKFVTMDMYRTQAFLSILLKVINESKKITMLRNIKKNNEITNENLLEMINTIEKTGKEVNINYLPINTFALIDNLSINEKQIKPSNFEFGILVLFLYNSEHLMLLEEDLNYDPLSSPKQFVILENVKISDIVQLKIFADASEDTLEDNKMIEINLIDESKNSEQITWTFRMTELHILSQFVTQIKETWESIFSIEMPINI